MSNISIVIRIMPQAEDLDVDLPLHCTGKQIVEELLGNNIVNRNDDQGNPIVYELVSKALGKKIRPEDQLQDLAIPNGDTLLLTPKVFAGAI